MYSFLASGVFIKVLHLCKRGKKQDWAERSWTALQSQSSLCICGCLEMSHLGPKWPGFLFLQGIHENYSESTSASTAWFLDPCILLIVIQDGIPSLQRTTSKLTPQPHLWYAIPKLYQAGSWNVLFEWWRMSTRNLSGETEIFQKQIVVMVAQLYKFTKNHRTMPSQWQTFICKLFLNIFIHCYWRDKPYITIERYKRVVKL